ncbi:hypothetical protein ACROYT_G011438 [Oculina patagonica]
MEEATPRGIIRGVLTTGGIGESVKLRQRRTPRAANAKETPVNPPSRSEVASRLLTRSRSANKRKATEGSTPADSTTPRTLIAGFLQTAPVAKSVVQGKRQRTTEPNTRRTSQSASQTEDNTPRTIIQNFLREALAESPEMPEILASLDAADENVLQQPDEETRISSITSIAADEAGTATDEQSITMTTSHQADHVTLMEEATLRLLDSYEEDKRTAQNTSSQEPQEEIDSLPSTAADQSLQTGMVTRGNASQTSRQWRDLVTPQLPLDVSSGVKGQLSRSQNVAERSVGEKPFFGGKPPTGKTGPKSSPTKRPSGPRMPSALVKSIFQHFSKAKLSKEALQAVENGSNLFFKQVSSDLMAYCRHAHRTTIELADVELLMKRQGFITDNQSLYSLVEKYLPLEYRQEVIPTVQAGNKIVLK